LAARSPAPLCVADDEVATAPERTRTHAGSVASPASTSRAESAYRCFHQKESIRPSGPPKRRLTALRTPGCRLQ